MKKALIFICIAHFFAYSQTTLAQHLPGIPPVNMNITADQWRADLRYFAEELPKRHKNLFHTMTREQFQAAVKKLDNEIPTLKNEDILIGFMRIIAMVGDGHTSIQEQSFFNFGIYPIQYRIYRDGVYVQSAPAEYNDILGGKVVKIGNVPIETGLKRINDISWGDRHNEQSKKVETAFLLSNPKVLQGLKIADSDERVSLTAEVNGQQRTVEVKAVKDVLNFFRTAHLGDANRAAKNPVPLYLKDHHNPYWFEYLKESRIMYVQFNEVLNKPDESVTVFFKRVFDQVENNPVDKFVLDVRMNTGGNNVLNKPIIIGLIRSKLNEQGKLFVIIGRQTFSAAQNLVNEIEKYTNVILVGEPTGSSPSHYGDPVIMTLPNSKLPFRVSTLFHQNISNDNRLFTTPDIFAELTPEDFRNNIDPALRAITNYVPGQTFKDLKSEAIKTNDVGNFVKKYREFKADPANKYVNTEADTNALGYGFLQLRKLNEAIEIFKLNTQAYPGSANVYDSLAEAYELSGNTAEAVKNYEKALSINPNSQSSANALRRLKNHTGN